jgi:hypothetical protein
VVGEVRAILYTGKLSHQVAESSYQCQIDRDGDQWVFRYDFLRWPTDPHPASHLQINAGVPEGWVPPGTPFGRIHFPTDRVSFEAVIRLLIEQFAVPPVESSELWRPLLAESESLFMGIRHRSISGPST